MPSIKKRLSQILFLNLFLVLCIFGATYNTQTYKSDEIEDVPNYIYEFNPISDVGILYDNDYFKYEPLENEDVDAAFELVTPTLIQLRMERSDGYYVNGSGFIYQITPENVYFLSVSHVTEDMTKGCKITFFDGNKIETKVKYIKASGRNEISLFKVKTSEIPKDTLIKLKEICIDETVYDTLQSNTLLARAVFFRNNDYNKDIVAKIYDTNFFDSYCNEITVISSRAYVGGMSGTAAVDARGRLLGFVWSYDSNQDYTFKIDKIAEVENRKSELD